MPDASFPQLPLDAKVLVFCPIGLGNFIMATPSLGLLSRHLGRDNMGILALKGGISELAEATSWFASIHFWDPDKEGLGRGLRLLAEIRRQGYTHSLSLFPTFHWKFGAFALACGARRRLGFGHARGRALGVFSEPFQHKLRADAALHDTDQNLRLVEACIGRRHPGPIRLTWPLPALKPGHAPGGNYAVIHPGSSAERGMEDKRLPPEIFADLMVRMHRQFGMVSVLVGGPEEKPLRQALAARVAALEARPGEGGGEYGASALAEVATRNLADLGGVVSGARLYLGNDSGIMHVAVALGIPCAAFFGPTDAERTGPYGWRENLGPRPRHLVVRRSDLACQPCRTGALVGSNPSCVTADIRCLRGFSADNAWAQIEPFIRRVLG